MTHERLRTALLEQIGTDRSTEAAVRQRMAVVSRRRTVARRRRCALAAAIGVVGAVFILGATILCVFLPAQVQQPASAGPMSAVAGDTAPDEADHYIALKPDTGTDEDEVHQEGLADGNGGTVQARAWQDRSASSNSYAATHRMQAC